MSVDFRSAWDTLSPEDEAAILENRQSLRDLAADAPRQRLLLAKRCWDDPVYAQFIAESFTRGLVEDEPQHWILEALQ